MKSAALILTCSAFVLPRCLADLHPAGTAAPPPAPAAPASGKSGPVFTSHVVTTETVGHAVAIDVDISGADKLWLVVTDGGNGFTADWADWVEPRISGDYGTQSLTALRWTSATSQWGAVGVDRNAAGQPMMVNDKPVAGGLGTHANSIIAFDLPPGTKRFQASGALDKGGADQGGASVAFQVWTTPPTLPASSTRGGPREPDAALGGLDVAEGLDATLFAAEPMLLSPSSMDIDARGRLWVAEIVNYRGHAGERPEGDRILILEDTDGNGTADKQTVFYQGADLISPHGICVEAHSAIISAGDKVFRLTDTDGDDHADKREVLFTGIQGTQHDHGIHAFHFGPDGKFYFNYGNAGGEIKDRDGKPITDMAGNVINSSRHPYQQGCVFRCNPDLTEMETLGWNFRNNWEVNTDSFGSIWQSDNDDDGNKSVRINFVMEFGNYGYCDEMTGASWQRGDARTDEEVVRNHWHLDDPGVVPNLLHTGGGSPTGILVYEGDLLPPVFRQQIIHADAGPNIVRAYPVTPRGAGYTARTEDILRGTRDNWFRPSDVCVAPDGSLFVADWYDPGVGGHGMGDTARGRIYRVAPPDALTKYQVSAPDFTTAAGAVKALANPCENTRYLAWQALAEMGAAATPALEALYQSGKPFERARALWAMGKLTPAGAAVVDKALTDRDPDIRITGLRLARQLKLDLVALTGRVVQDPSAMVRREAAIALRHLRTPAAAQRWAQLAVQHDGLDPWYLAALNIGAQLHWDECLDAWLAAVKDNWDTPGGRDIIRVSRGTRSAELLAAVLTESPVPAAEKLRFVRSFDFQADESSRAAIASVLRSGAPMDDALIMALARTNRDFSLANAPDGIRAAVLRALEGTRGQRSYYDFVSRYQVKSETPALLQLASDQSVGEAWQALFALGAGEAVKAALLAATPDRQPALAASMVQSQRREAVDLVTALVRDPASTPEFRQAMVKALGRSRGGEAALLEGLKAGTLPGDAVFAASQVLHASPDGRTRAAAEAVVPLPKALGDKPLPPVAELVKRSGQATAGQAVYGKFCQTCHRVGDAGLDFGPALSEIGSKLAKEALYQAILDPNAGISFGFEGWQVKTKAGDSYLGMVSSETDGELALKVPGGVIVKLAKADITEREKLPVSLMTPGLASAMQEQELVDLVEYLSTLKKP